MKTTLIALAAAALGVAIASPSFAKTAGCHVERNGRIIVKGDCKFYSNGPRGSFQLSGDYKDNLGRGVAHVDVKITRPGIGVVYAMLSGGRYVRWGTVTRLTSDRACWIGSGMEICAR
jgi:hypothetical protein